LGRILTFLGLLGLGGVGTTLLVGELRRRRTRVSAYGP